MLEAAESPYLPDGRQWAWDSSSLDPAKSCARKYYYQQILGYRQKGENVIRSIIWYLDQFGENDPCKTVHLADGTPAVELSFRFQLTDEIWLCGHLDRLVEYGDGVYVQDQKTTGSTLGGYYFKRYNP